MRISLACRSYDRTAALNTGAVRADGLDIDFLDLPVEETFYRQMMYREFDACECGLSLLIGGNSAFRDDHVAIPAFVSRAFRHGCVFVTARSGITQPAHLVGKRIAVPEYQMTAAIWIRGLLSDEFGIEPTDVRWFTGGLEQPGRAQKVKLEIPGVEIRRIEPDQTINQLLLDGELDGYIGARVPTSYRGADGAVRRLLPDYRQREEAYYLRTGIFPTMHCVVIKRSLYERDPWLARSLYDAFCRAKDWSEAKMRDSSALQYMLPWTQAEVEHVDRTCGPDMWRYGVEENLATLTRLCDYARKQSVAPELFEPTALFVPSTQSKSRV